MESSHITTLDGDLILRRELGDIWIDNEGTFKKKHVVRLSWKDSTETSDWQWPFVNRDHAEAFRDHLIAQLCSKVPFVRPE